MFCEFFFGQSAVSSSSQSISHGHDHQSAVAGGSGQYAHTCHKRRQDIELAD
jgi:hypothetical protein